MVLVGSWSKFQLAPPLWSILQCVLLSPLLPEILTGAFAAVQRRNRGLNYECVPSGSTLYCQCGCNQVWAAVFSPIRDFHVFHQKHWERQADSRKPEMRRERDRLNFQTDWFSYFHHSDLWKWQTRTNCVKVKYLQTTWVDLLVYWSNCLLQLGDESNTNVNVHGSDTLVILMDENICFCRILLHLLSRIFCPTFILKWLFGKENFLTCLPDRRCSCFPSETELGNIVVVDFFSLVPHRQLSKAVCALVSTVAKIWKKCTWPLWMPINLWCVKSQRLADCFSVFKGSNSPFRREFCCAKVISVFSFLSNKVTHITASFDQKEVAIWDPKYGFGRSYCSAGG